MTAWSRTCSAILALCLAPIHAHAQICDAWVPTADCGGTFDVAGDDEKRFERDIFLSWVLEEWRVGNIEAMQDMLFSAELADAPVPTTFSPLSERFDWLEDKADLPVADVLWCSLNSVKDTPVFLSNFVVPEFMQADNKTAVAEVTFWLGYDLATHASRSVVAHMDQELTLNGDLSGLPKDSADLSAARKGSLCLGIPMMNKVLDEGDVAASPRLTMMRDAADAADHLARALEAEVAAALNHSASEEESEDTWQKEVNDQLLAEVSNADGLIEVRILSEAKLLSQAFQNLGGKISEHARDINRLNADLMAVDRNLRTYTEVFADHNKDDFDKRFVQALIDLESVLAERKLLGDTQTVWMPYVDSNGVTDTNNLQLNPDNETVSRCQTDPDCDYCQISEPLSPENLEEHLLCFHALGRQQAEVARNAALAPEDGNFPGDETLDWYNCLKDIGSELPVEDREDAAKQCFLTWMWNVDPLMSAQMEAAFEHRN